MSSEYTEEHCARIAAMVIDRAIRDIDEVPFVPGRTEWTPTALKDKRLALRIKIEDARSAISFIEQDTSNFRWMCGGLGMDPGDVRRELRPRIKRTRQRIAELRDWMRRIEPVHPPKQAPVTVAAGWAGAWLTRP